MIRGNTVSTNMPRTDYAQTDPTKADYLKNRPSEAIEKAQRTADNALPKAGGTMTGSVNMNGNRIQNVQTPKNSGDAVNKSYSDSNLNAAKGYTDSKHTGGTGTLTAEWTGSEAPYTQTVAFDGILEEDRPHVAPVYSDTLETALLEKEGWAFVSDAYAVAGGITFVCFEDKPSTAINIQVEVNR